MSETAYVLERPISCPTCGEETTVVKIVVDGMKVRPAACGVCAQLGPPVRKRTLGRAGRSLKRPRRRPKEVTIVDERLS
jgi:hypothetical protein